MVISEILYKCHASKESPKFIYFISIQLVITVWQIHVLVW